MLDADERPTCTQLLSHSYFNHDNFGHRFILELRTKMSKEFGGSILTPKKSKVSYHGNKGRRLVVM